MLACKYRTMLGIVLKLCMSDVHQLLVSCGTIFAQVYSHPSLLDETWIVDKMMWKKAQEQVQAI